MAEVKAPIAILAAEIDKISPPELIKQFEGILSSKPEVHEHQSWLLGFFRYSKKIDVWNHNAMFIQGMDK